MAHGCSPKAQKGQQMVALAIPLLLKPSSPSLGLLSVTFCLQVIWVDPKCPHTLIVLNSPNISSQQLSAGPWLPNQSPSCLRCVAINAPQWVMPLNRGARSWVSRIPLPLIIILARRSDSGKSHRSPGLISAALLCPCWENLLPHGLLSNTRPPLLPATFNGGGFVKGVSASFFLSFFFFPAWLCSCYEPLNPAPQQNVFPNVTQIVGTNSSVHRDAAAENTFYLLFPVSDLSCNQSYTNLFLFDNKTGLI